MQFLFSWLFAGVQERSFIVFNINEEAVEGGAMDMEALGDVGQRKSPSECFEDIGFLAGELVVFVAATRYPSDVHAFCAPAGKCFFGALGDEVPLDFGGESEGEGQHFGLYVLTEAVVVFDGPDAAFLVHADVEDFHNHEEAAAESGEFGADDDVVFPDAPEEFAELAFAVVFGAGDGFFDPSVNPDIPVFAEAVDFEALVFDCLFVRRYADVTVNHSDVILRVNMLPKRQ